MAARFTANARWQITPGGKLRLPKIGDVAVRWSRELPSAPSSVTVIKGSNGRYFHRIGRFEPTSQICSQCEMKDGPSRCTSASGSARAAGRGWTGT
jgi:hypothetical protein